MSKSPDRSESDALADRIEADIASDGFGLSAVEIPDVARFIGFVGFAAPRFEAYFTTCIETRMCYTGSRHFIFESKGEKIAA